MRFIDDLVVRDRDSNGGGTLNERLYALDDPLGSVVAVVNSAGAVQERYAYSSYGAPFFLSAAFGMESGTVVDWETLLAAYRADSCTGLYMARSRFFHCALGVWLSRDRIGTRSRRDSQPSIALAIQSQ